MKRLIPLILLFTSVVSFAEVCPNLEEVQGTPFVNVHELYESDTDKLVGYLAEGLFLYNGRPWSLDSFVYEDAAKTLSDAEALKPKMHAPDAHVYDDFLYCYYYQDYSKDLSKVIVASPSDQWNVIQSLLNLKVR